MYGWITCIILIVFLIYLFCKFREKQELDLSEKNKLNTEIELLKQQRSILKSDIDDLQQKTDIAIERYTNAQRDKAEELEQYFEGQKRRRQEIMDADMLSRSEALNKGFEAEREKLQLGLQAYLSGLQEQVDEVQAETNSAIENYIEQAKDIQTKYEGLLAPIKQYEMDRQQRLYYTIQLPEEYQADINFLLTTVAEKVQHPDIISKLVWSEYVKPYLDDTCKRVNITDEAGIYKLTNLDNGKSYIGKSTNVKKRIQDHFKSSVGIKSIADQAVHHEILKTGFWNWTIEVITYCDKDKLSELEKYYIDFFKTQEFGYNRKEGG